MSSKTNLTNSKKNTRTTLKGVRVLIARPHDQGKALTSQLKQLGAEVIQFPTIAVESSPSSQPLKNCFLNLDQYSHVIAISVHAVRYGLEWINQYWPQLPLNIQWYGVGEKTAQALKDADIPAIASETGYDSESLLNLPELTELAHQKILILRGEGGRELLKQQFEQQGAKVDYANLYQRSCPTYSVSEINNALITFSPDILITLSGETLHNLIKISQNKDIAIEQRNRIMDKYVLVPSQRVADQARSLGFSKVWVPKALNEQALVECIESNYVALNDMS
ncbi:uroporphyrinogen-III synthase [Alkalimarinus alittae]|uniref:Uroporphyrinogen-III synthase n=1 Tax=Alkalimarinus alittae TaxID=2961619 RepID=A0ABY6N2Y7_9ALTE|nr:uroporphyrinogen-III synthase [Alkalimarinus alittae]UZE96451.1 uroporphyrinogen-III synthase [Alkalimarinus alittae]